MTGMLAEAQPPWAHGVLEQLRTESGCLLQCPDDEVLALAPRSGALPGSSVGTLYFNHTCRRGVLQPWLCADRDQVRAHDFAGGGEEVRVDTTVYVDDIARRYVGRAWSTLVRRAAQGEAALAQATATARLATHLGKKEAVVSAHRGLGAHALLRGLRRGMQAAGATHLGRCPKAARYLGPHLDQAQSFAAERPGRIDGARAAWVALRRFWSAGAAPRAMRLRVFRAAVVSVLLSGVEAFVLTLKDMEVLGAYMVGRVRALLRGIAHEVAVGEGGEARHRAMSNQEVLQCPPWQLRSQ